MVGENVFKRGDTGLFSPSKNCLLGGVEELGQFLSLRVSVAYQEEEVRRQQPCSSSTGFSVSVYGTILEA